MNLFVISGHIERVRVTREIGANTQLCKLSARSKTGNRGLQWGDLLPSIGPFTIRGIGDCGGGTAARNSLQICPLKGEV
jgi:hypothetical protein